MAHWPYKTLEIQTKKLGSLHTIGLENKRPADFKREGPSRTSNKTPWAARNGPRHSKESQPSTAKPNTTPSKETQTSWGRQSKIIETEGFLTWPMIRPKAGGLLALQRRNSFGSVWFPRPILLHGINTPSQQNLRSDFVPVFQASNF